MLGQPPVEISLGLPQEEQQLILQTVCIHHWSGDTKMNCLHQILNQVKEIGYAHHIQRLMY